MTRIEEQLCCFADNGCDLLAGDRDMLGKRGDSRLCLDSCRQHGHCSGTTTLPEQNHAAPVHSACSKAHVVVLYLMLMLQGPSRERQR